MSAEGERSKTKVARKRRSYTEDLNRDAVALVTDQSYKVFDAACSLDIGENLVRRWRRGFGEAVSVAGGLNAHEREELQHLRKEIRLLRMEKEILKKASQYFAKEMK